MQGFAKLVHTKVIRLAARAFERLRPGKTVDRPVILVATRLGDDVDDAALRLAVLWLETPGLDLHLLDESSIDAHAECAVRARKDAKSAECRIGDADTVSNVEVVER